MEVSMSATISFASSLKDATPMYFLIFATDNDAGEKIMDWVFDRVRLRVQEELGQTTLFDMESGPRERRLNDG
jgi:hypothetical protein